MARTKQNKSSKLHQNQKSTNSYQLYKDMKRARKASASRKRKLNEMDQDLFESENHQNSMAKRNVYPSKNRRAKIKIKSSLFTHKSDQKQFKKIFKSIEKSSIIQILSISHDINKQIAEFATGNLVICENNECGEMVPTLHGDEGEYVCPGCDEIVQLYSCSSCNKHWVSSNDDEFYSCPTCEECICADCRSECNTCQLNICAVCLGMECGKCNKKACPGCTCICDGCGDIRICCKCSNECDICGKMNVCNGCMKGKCDGCYEIACWDCASGIDCECCTDYICGPCGCNITGLCSICGEDVCYFCISIEQEKYDKRFDYDEYGGEKIQIRCVCSKCCNKDKARYELQ